MRFRMSGMILFVLLATITGVPSFAQEGRTVRLLANMNKYPSVGYSGIWGYTAPNGREYALLGVRNGVSVVDITTNNPVEVGFIPNSTSSWKEIKTYRNYAYAISDNAGQGMHIIDLSPLPNPPTLAATFTGFLTSHNLYIDEPNAMLYAEGSAAQPVRAYSLADPLNPVLVSTFGVECHDIYARDNIVYVSEGNQGTIGIFDLSNPASPVLLRRFPIPQSGFVHNAWLTDDGNYLLTTEETTGKTVKMFDIQNLSNVFITDQYLGPSNLAHNVYTKGSYAYIAHYSEGLKVVDISDPFNIFEVGSYDTYPGTGGFNGAWGAYPFFPSGKIVVSDIQTGLYVFSFTPPPISLTLTPQGAPIVIPPQGGQYSFRLTVTNNGTANQRLRVWNTIVLPNGTSTGPSIGPFNVNLTPGQTFSEVFSRTMAPGDSAGTYQHIFNAGPAFPAPIHASDRFSFTKSSAAN